jgi:serine/threonine-protein kinase
MTAVDAEVRLEPGASFGRYEIVRRLGRGGMGAVYEGIHVDLKKRVAVKVLLPPMSESPDLRARFVREGQAAARIRHPHVVDIYDVNELNGVPFMVMEYLEGEDLGALLSREKRLAPERAADLMVPVLAAMSAAHEEGVIHRDLKPANIFLARDRYGEIHPKILDFGISKVTSDRLQEGLTGTGAVFGTPFYMSPEQALGGKLVDGQSDQYSLGVILYQCLTGKRPFEADSMYQILHGIVQGTFLLPRMINPEVPEPLEDIIVRAMAKKREDRFPGVREFGAALVSFASQRTRAHWSHVFPPARAASVPKPRLEQTAAMPLSDPATALAETMPPEPRPVSVIAAPGASRTILVVAALAGLALSVIVGTAIWFATRPVQPLIIDIPPAPIEAVEEVKEEPPLVREAPPEPAPALAPPVKKQVVSKKKKKKTMTGSNDAPILE